MKRILCALGIALFWTGPAFAVVDVNLATEKDLKTLEGITPATARAIIRYRSQHGPYKSVDDLTKVPGVTKAFVARNRKLLTLTGDARTRRDTLIEDQGAAHTEASHKPPSD